MALTSNENSDLEFWKKHLDSLTGGLVNIEGEKVRGDLGFDFSYITDYLPSKDVQIPSDPPIGCLCQVVVLTISIHSKDNFDTFFPTFFSRAAQEGGIGIVALPLEQM